MAAQRVEKAMHRNRGEKKEQMRNTVMKKVVQHYLHLKDKQSLATDADCRGQGARW